MQFEMGNNNITTLQNLDLEPYAIIGIATSIQAARGITVYAADYYRSKTLSAYDTLRFQRAVGELARLAGEVERLISRLVTQRLVEKPVFKPVGTWNFAEDWELYLSNPSDPPRYKTPERIRQRRARFEAKAKARSEGAESREESQSS